MTGQQYLGSLEKLRFEISIGDSAYPERLRDLETAPERLYGIGDPDALKIDSVAIVGARKATPYGHTCADMLVKEAVASHAAIVTGGALGVGTTALATAIGQGGTAVAVLGCGCDVAYPARNSQLFRDIAADGGCLVSEQPWGTPALRYNFPYRNRMIAALPKAVAAIECGLPSGTFSIADTAMVLGRYVLAVPGAITSPQSAGCNQLIKGGAEMIVGAQDFADALEGYGIGFRTVRMPGTDLLSCCN